MKTAAEPLVGVINAGSSSVKFSIYEGENRLLAGQVDGIGVHPRHLLRRQARCCRRFCRG
jgi:acetate kinase